MVIALTDKINIININPEYVGKEIVVEGIVDEIKDLDYAEIVYLLELPSILSQIEAIIEDIKVIFENDLMGQVKGGEKISVKGTLLMDDEDMSYFIQATDIEILPLPEEDRYIELEIKSEEIGDEPLIFRVTKEEYDVLESESQMEGIPVEEYFKKVMSFTGNIDEDLEKYMQIQNYEKEIEEHLKKINELSNKIDQIKKTLE